MKVLLVHNRYRQHGGEDAVVESEDRLLQSRGHAVERFERSNDEIDESSAPLSLALDTVWSRSSARALSAQLEAFRPDIVHVHNTFPLLSPSIYWTAAAHRVPVVQTLHNFRLACPQAMLLRQGRVCEECLGRLPIPALVHACYQGSRTRTAVVVSMLGVHRALGTWRRQVMRFIALNAFCRDKFIAAGLPAERIVIKPNFVEVADRVIDGPRNGFLYVGRLSEEKGVDLIAEAIGRVPEAHIRVAGRGPREAWLEGVQRVQGLGALDAAAVAREMSQALALVMPSLWYENFPRTLVEAFACGLPVIASRLGALADLVEHGRTGLLFEPGSAASLAEALRFALGHPQAMREMGRNARRVHASLYSPEVNYRQLIDIYQDALAESLPMRLAGVRVLGSNDPGGAG